MSNYNYIITVDCFCNEILKKWNLILYFTFSDFFKVLHFFFFFFFQGRWKCIYAFRQISSVGLLHKWPYPLKTPPLTRQTVAPEQLARCFGATVYGRTTAETCSFGLLLIEMSSTRHPFEAANFFLHDNFRQLLVEFSTLLFRWLWPRLAAYRNQKLLTAW